MFHPDTTAHPNAHPACTVRSLPASPDRPTTTAVRRCGLGTTRSSAAATGLAFLSQSSSFAAAAHRDSHLHLQRPDAGRRSMRPTVFRRRSVRPARTRARNARSSAMSPYSTRTLSSPERRYVTVVAPSGVPGGQHARVLVTARRRYFDDVRAPCRTGDRGEVVCSPSAPARTGPVAGFELSQLPALRASPPSPGTRIHRGSDRRGRAESVSPVKVERPTE